MEVKLKSMLFGAQCDRGVVGSQSGYPVIKPVFLVRSPLHTQ